MRQNVVRRASLLRNLILCATSLALTACAPSQEARTVDLSPNDPRPIYAVSVGDSDEAQIIAQVVPIEVVVVEGGRIYFHADDGALSNLRDLGYAPDEANAYTVYRRTVQVPADVSEETLKQYGLTFLNRESTYQVVQGNLSSVRALSESGVSIKSIFPGEPYPRVFTVDVFGQERLRDLVELDFLINHIDLVPNQLSARFIVHGEALDYKIDELIANGFSVQVMPR